MGFVGFMYRQKRCHPQPITSQNLSGQTALITGANGGIGLATARLLMEFRVSCIIMAVRTTSSGEKAKADLLKAHPSCTVEVWPLDMESFDSVLAFGNRIQDIDRLDMAYLNAGVKKQAWEVNSLTGHETTIQINHLSTSLLSLLLLRPLRATAAKLSRPSRLTITSSEVHMWTSFKEGTAPNILVELDKESNWGNPDRYNVSKLLNVLWTRELASKVDAQDIIINTVNPGLVKSTLHRENTNAMETKFTNFFGWTTEEAARTLVTAAVIQGPQSHGCYMSECKLTAPSEWVRSAGGKAIQKRLWDQTIQTLESDSSSKLESCL